MKANGCGPETDHLTELYTKMFDRERWGVLRGALAFTLAASACSPTDGTPDGASPGGAAGQAINIAGGAGSSNVAGAMGSAGNNAAGGASAGASLGGNAGASSGAPTGGSNASTSGTGGASGSGGSGGAGGGQTGSDRCEVAKLDASKPPQSLALTGSLGTHDPVVIAADGKYYLFSTGNNIGAKTSSNLLSWQGAPDVLGSSTRPSWLSQRVPGVSNLWAPDISYFGGAYHLYYSASTFGSNRSCIGHLSRPSLSQGAWTERGEVICSNVTTDDNWNAIDPNVVVEPDGTPWLSFGSFWGGIKLIKLDSQGARVGTTLDSIAARPSAGGALEAPFIVRRCGYYYLFVSWDKCCSGVDSTYNIRVGRSANVQGPYLDREGKSMQEGGGSLLVQGGARFKGPGHNAVLFTETAAYNVYHAYDANSNGASTLRISELAWDEAGWPTSAGP